MALPVLYSFRRCPYAMRARLAIAISGVAVELREIKLSAKPEVLLEASPKGTVPVLVLPSGQVLEQSLDIMLWALGQHDPQSWLHPSQGTQAEMQALIAECDGPFKHHLDRTKYPGRFADAQGREYHRAQAVAVLLQALEARLRVAPQLGGAAPCATDIGIFPFVRQFAAADPVWWTAQPLPAVQAWLAGWLAHPLFERAMRKLPDAAAGQIAG